MPTKLEKLLEEIDPKQTIDIIEKRIEKALSNYHRDKNTVDSWEEYEKCLADFTRLARNAVTNMPPGAGDDLGINFGEALRYLSKEYPNNTMQTVYEIMRTGVEGGIYQIIKTLARIMAEEFSQNKITSRVVDYWNSLSIDEQLQAPDEYIKKYKDILPSRILERPARFKGFFWKVLEQHPKMIKSVRDLGQNYHWNI